MNFKGVYSSAAPWVANNNNKDLLWVIYIAGGWSIISLLIGILGAFIAKVNPRRMDTVLHQNQNVKYGWAIE